MIHADTQYLWGTVYTIEALDDRQQIGKVVETAALMLRFESVTQLMNAIDDDALFEILIYHLGRGSVDLEEPSDGDIYG